MPLQNVFNLNVCDLWINMIWLIYHMYTVIPKEINIMQIICRSTDQIISYVDYLKIL